MPVTAKLSRKFYETFGDDIANELVEWFNQVDATYRADLRELNELNFARFDAKLEQRIAELKARIDRNFTKFTSTIAAKFAEIEAKFPQVEAKFARELSGMERRLGSMEQGLGSMERHLGGAEQRLSGMERRLEKFKTELEQSITDLRVGMEGLEGRLIRWMVGLWAGTTVTFVGALVALLKL